jgi:SAM-dependent methyltransferase
MKFKIKTLDSVNNPNSVHGIYPYRGKISAIDAEQILSQIPAGSVVLDPFCGSGTIVYEGLKFGLKTFGIDANPIAILLSNGKIHIPRKLTSVQEELDMFIQKANNLKEEPVAPDYTTSLFHKDSLSEIMRLSVFFDKMDDYLKSCFIGAIALTARGCNDYKWTSSTVGKNMPVKRYIPFYEKINAKVKKHYFPISNDSKVFYGDSRNARDLILKESVDFIFSSPPYFDCLDYTAYYARIVYEILGYDRLAIKDTLIQDFSNYKSDMTMVLKSLYDVLKPGGQVIFVVGDKKIHGKIINGADFFNEISPFNHIETIERSYNGTSSKVFDKINKTERKEQIIIWQKKKN